MKIVGMDMLARDHLMDKASTHISFNITTFMSISRIIQKRKLIKSLSSSTQHQIIMKLLHEAQKSTKENDLRYRWGGKAWFCYVVRQKQIKVICQRRKLVTLFHENLIAREIMLQDDFNEITDSSHCQLVIIRQHAFMHHEQSPMKFQYDYHV